MRRVWILKNEARLWWGAAIVTAGLGGWISSNGGQVPAAEKGVVVEEVGEGSVLEKAGLRSGDVILSWERLPSPPNNPEGAEGPIESIFDWMWIEVEQAPRGTVKLMGQRDGVFKVFEVEPGRWEASVRARMDEGMLRDYVRGKELIGAEDLEAGVELWYKVAGLTGSQETDEYLRCWLLLRIGIALTHARQLQRAQGAFRSALDTARDPWVKVVVWQSLGDAYENAVEFEAAQQAYRSAQEIREKTWGETLAFAEGLNTLGTLDWRQGRLDAAQGNLQHALEILQRLAPGSLEMAASLNSLGNLASDRGDLGRAAGYYRESLEIRQELAPGGLDVAASLNNLGNLTRKRGDLDMAAEYYKKSLGIRQKLVPDSLEVAMSMENLGILAYTRGILDEAAKYYEESLKIRQKQAPGSLEVAGSLSDLGGLAYARGDFDLANEYHQASLDIRQKLAPSSLYVAASLNNLGLLAWQSGDLSLAAEYYQRSLDIQQKLAPESLDVAMSLNNLGVLAYVRDDLDLAAKYFQQSLEMRQELASGSLDVAASLANLGNLAYDRGDLDQAATHYEAALKIFQRLAPRSLDVARVMNNLGLSASGRGELDRAVEYYEEALGIFQELAPGRLDLASIMNNLGLLATARGDLNDAAEFYKQALGIEQRFAPDSLGVASILHNLGFLASKSGDLSRAEEYFERALEIQEGLAPGSLNSAASLNDLGLLAYTDGDFSRAEECYERALKIQQKLAPGSSVEVEILHGLGTLRRKQGQLQTALTLLLQALEALEDQVTRLGGSREARANFRANRVAYYHDTIGLSMELHLTKEAFHILESSRARSFLAQLAERDLMFSDVPEELERQRRKIVWHYNRTQENIAQLRPSEQSEEVETLLDQLHQLRRDYEDITQKIVKVSPKLAKLHYPEPLDLGAARQALDFGTVMLSYSIGEEVTYLFVLSREEELQVKTLPLGEQELRGEVQRILGLQRTRSTAPYKEPLHKVGERLYQALIQPAEESIAKSKRVLIVPDGPLHLLPFALLVRRTGPGDRDFEYLVEWKPLHSVLSATVYAELKNQRRSPSDKEEDVLALAAFGDPRYSSARSADELVADRSVDVYVRSAAERGFDFRPLPYSREEVNRIAALYPEGAARTFLGADASEEQAKSVGRRARILHFATHGRFDDRFPLNSYLALTLPEEFRKDQENGLLQVWEIFEDVRLDADLVVLSACESGLGEEIDGEGLKGLVRAFQFAGARTVVASLWQVEDRATAELMTRFYRHLRAGTSKDEALRAAQLELIRGPVEVENSQGRVVKRDLSLPYYWAAFQMIGDWR